MNRKGIVYKATDNILNKSYIGCTLNSLKNRMKQHIRQSKTDTSNRYYDTFHKMLRILGPENFSWVILEDNIERENLGEREKFYIRKYNTYADGYNSTLGGKSSSSSYSYLKEQQVENIINLLKETDESMTKIAKKFNITRDMVSDINCGETWYNSKLKYPIRENDKYRKKAFSNKEVLKIISLLKEDYTFKYIADLFECHPTTIKKISEGDAYKIANEKYPIRKHTYEKCNDETVKCIINYLMKTNLSQNKIAEKVGVNRKVVNNINIGRYYSLERLKDLGVQSIPIRKN